MSDDFISLEPASAGDPAWPTAPQSGVPQPAAGVATPAPFQPTPPFQPSPGAGLPQPYPPAGPPYATTGQAGAQWGSQGAPYGTPQWATPPEKPSRSWLWVGLGVAAALAVVVIAVVVSGGSSGTGPTHRPARFTEAPADAQTVSGPSGWSMGIDPQWQDVGDDSVEGRWLTGAGDATFSSIVNVTTETPPMSATLDTYMKASEQNLGGSLQEVTLVSNEVLDAGDHDVGRVEFSFTAQGIDLTSVTYVVKIEGVFVIVTYVALSDGFAAEVLDVEPYIASIDAF